MTKNDLKNTNWIELKSMTFHHLTIWQFSYCQYSEGRMRSQKRMKRIPWGARINKHRKRADQVNGEKSDWMKRQHFSHSIFFIHFPSFARLFFLFLLIPRRFHWMIEIRRTTNPTRAWRGKMSMAFFSISCVCCGRLQGMSQNEWRTYSKHNQCQSFYVCISHSYGDSSILRVVFFCTIE